jgi:hypothetical protein
VAALAGDGVWSQDQPFNLGRADDMAVYIVTYDLNKESARPNIVGDIKKTWDWARLSESSYAIDTGQTSEEVYNHLSRHLDDNDNLYVISLKRPYSGRGPQDVNDWLERSLTW